MKEITINRDIGNAKKGTKFLLGLYGIPDYEDYKNTKSEEWYWVKGSVKSDNKFLRDTWLTGGGFSYIKE